MGESLKKTHVTRNIFIRLEVWGISLRIGKITIHDSRNLIHDESSFTFVEAHLCLLHPLDKMKKQILFISMVVLLQVANCVLPTISYSQKIAGGAENSLAICNDSTVQAWGDNYYGELGNGTNGYYASSNIPVQVNSISDITTIAGGLEHLLALKNDGTVWAWGSNDN